KEAYASIMEGVANEDVRKFVVAWNGMVLFKVAVGVEIVSKLDSVKG
ncbi:hypothetical protein A2U01_0019374, partial [Trifolium medium]|nr:hypothetical protein [Trifolium medium]